ncbi:uncharacterized protein V6R79_008108 [Siganus canaliculatus]
MATVTSSVTCRPLGLVQLDLVQEEPVFTPDQIHVSVKLLNCGSSPVLPVDTRLDQSRWRCSDCISPPVLQVALLCSDCISPPVLQVALL